MSIYERTVSGLNGISNGNVEGKLDFTPCGQGLQTLVSFIFNVYICTIFNFSNTLEHYCDIAHQDASLWTHWLTLEVSHPKIRLWPELPGIRS